MSCIEGDLFGALIFGPKAERASGYDVYSTACRIEALLDGVVPGFLPGGWSALKGQLQFLTRQRPYGI